jgi:hypothetical protein
MDQPVAKVRLALFASSTLRMYAMKQIIVAVILICPICASAGSPWDEVLPPPRPVYQQTAPWVSGSSESKLPVRSPEDFSNLLKQAEPIADPWQGLRYDPGRLKLSRESIVESVKVQSTVDFADHREQRLTPWRSGDWRAEESLNVPLPAVDSMFVYGKLDSEGEAYDSRRVRMTGKTGLGWKWVPFDRGEIQFRSGPVLNVSDVYSPVRPQQKSQLSVELQAKLDLFGPLQLKYSGEALPALIEADRHTVLQDLKLAVPFGSNREFHIGAKYRWEDLSPTPWLDRTQLYLGLKFQH